MINGRYLRIRDFNNIMDIIGYQGLYKIYEDGRVFGIKRNKFLKPYINNGYYNVNLSKNGKLKFIKIHILVATHFIGERPIGYDIDHKDRNPLNNNVSNLRFISRSENNKNRYVYGKIPYRHIYKYKNEFSIEINENGKRIFRKRSNKLTLDEAVKVRNEAYKRLGIEIDDRVRPS